MDLDTGAAVNTFPLNVGPAGAGDGRLHRAASGESIPDGGWTLAIFKVTMTTVCYDF